MIQINNCESQKVQTLFYEVQGNSIPYSLHLQTLELYVGQ